MVEFDFSSIVLPVGLVVLVVLIYGFSELDALAAGGEPISSSGPWEGDAPKSE